MLGGSCGTVGWKAGFAEKGRRVDNWVDYFSRDRREQHSTQRRVSKCIFTRIVLLCLPFVIRANSLMLQTSFVIRQASLSKEECYYSIG
jgi:hypothetical protein